MKDKVGLFFILALALFGLDVLTKYFIKATLGPLAVIKVLPFFNIVYVENTGSAFGMFKGLGNLFFVAVSSLAMAVVYGWVEIAGRDRRTGVFVIALAFLFQYTSTVFLAKTVALAGAQGAAAPWAVDRDRPSGRAGFVPVRTGRRT